MAPLIVKGVIVLDVKVQINAVSKKMIVIFQIIIEVLMINFGNLIIFFSLNYFLIFIDF